MITVSAPTPLERLFTHLGWSRYIRDHRDFPLSHFKTTVDLPSAKIYVEWRDKRTGEIGALPDNIVRFPTPALIASFQLLAGPIDNIRADYNRILNRRTRRHL